MISMDSAVVSDEQLWRLACDGNRDAFSGIVQRYETLVCSIAYSACGALGTVGIFSLSVFWGVAVGVFALGSLAFGWWAVGCAAAAAKCAVGFAAVARDYAVGVAASAARTGQTARAWLSHEWFGDFKKVILHQAHWWILGMALAAVALNLWQKRRNWPFPLFVTNQEE